MNFLSDPRHDPEFHTELRRIRNAMGLTRHECAARLGISLTTLDKWEAPYDQPGSPYCSRPNRTNLAKLKDLVNDYLSTQERRGAPAKSDTREVKEDNVLINVKSITISINESELNELGVEALNNLLGLSKTALEETIQSVSSLVALQSKVTDQLKTRTMQ